MNTNSTYEAALANARTRTVAGTVADTLAGYLALHAGDSRAVERWRSLVDAVDCATDASRTDARDAAGALVRAAQTEMGYVIVGSSDERARAAVDTLISRRVAS